jgi:hypothetical protein
MTKELPSGAIRVVEVIDQFRCAINKGSDDGVNIGQRLLVYGLGKDITDPDTGEMLGTLEIVRGRGRVTHVQPRLATIETYEKEQQMRKIKRGSPFTIAMLGETIEEINSADDIPFNDVSEGDYAKFI